MAKSTRDYSEQEYLDRAWDQNICPKCGKSIGPEGRVGSGRKADGGFCSLNCYAEYYEGELRSKARQVGTAPSSSES